MNRDLISISALFLLQVANITLAAEPVEEDAGALGNLLKTRAAYQNSAKALEEQRVAFSEELTQALLGLGQTQNALEEYEEAALTFSNLLQIVRIHRGLNSPYQLPIIQQLLVSLQAMENWREVDANLHLYFHIAKQNYAVGDKRRLYALEQLSNWKLNNALKELTFGFSISAEEASSLYKKEITQLAAIDDYPEKNNHLALLYLRQAEINLTLAAMSLDAPLGKFETGTRPITTEKQCTAVLGPDGRAAWVCNDIPVPNLNYYLDPALRKNQSIGSYLSDMKESIVNAHIYLQKETNAVEERNLLLGLMQTLTEDYNRFVTDNSL